MRIVGCILREFCPILTWLSELKICYIALGRTGNQPKDKLDFLQFRGFVMNVNLIFFMAVGFFLFWFKIRSRVLLWTLVLIMKVHFKNTPGFIQEYTICVPFHDALASILESTQPSVSSPLSVVFNYRRFAYTKKNISFKRKNIIWFKWIQAFSRPKKTYLSF